MFEWPRTLVFTANAPQSSAAQAQVLMRLISGAEENFGFVHQVENLSSQERYPVQVPVTNIFQNQLLGPAVWRIEQFGWYYPAVTAGLREANRSNWDVILAFHPSMSFALAAAEVARRKKLPLVLHLNDIFAESRVNLLEKAWASVSEKRLMLQAASVICLTEGLQRHYSQKYGLDPVLIPHCVTEAEISAAAAHKPGLEVGSPVVVAYAGGVYQARLDSLLLVKQAIEILNARGCPAQLLILGKNKPHKLAEQGMGGPYVTARFVENRNEFMKQLSSADILLSTVAFKSDYPLQDQTCFPTKTIDYFLAGKPVLVVAPENLDYIAYMRQSSSGLIVTVPSAEVIADRITLLATDMAVRKQFVEAGFSKLESHKQSILRVSLQKALVQSARSS